MTASPSPGRRRRAAPPRGGRRGRGEAPGTVARALRALGYRILGLELGAFALWAVAGTVYSTVAGRVADWNAMSDELHYERSAISIVQTGSLVPQLHGHVVRALAQLYPALIAPWYLHGGVPADLHDAHVFDGWLMSSACIPAFLLARRVTGRRAVAFAVAFLAVCLPWMIYTTVLLTEVAGYPAFFWALLAMHRTATAPSRRNDLLAIAALVVAFLARTQFLTLAGVLPAALAVHHLTVAGRERLAPRLRAALRAHAVLAVFCLALALAAVAVEATGHSVHDLTVYGSQFAGLAPPGTAGSLAQHAADLAFGLFVLPFVVGAAWLLANALRPSASESLHAFACLGAVALVAIGWEISTWDIHNGAFTNDRYLFYLVPVLLLATFCALLDARRPRWSLLPPAALVAWGFARHLQEQFLWSGQFPLSTDSPISWLYKPIADATGGTTGASALLASATVALAALFAVADRHLRRATLTAGVSALLLLAFPVDTAITFGKLFSRPGHSGRPLTRSESGILDWIDRAVGTGATVTEVPYPISTAFLVNQEFWRDVEFWNKSVRYAIHYPTAAAYADAVIWFPNNPIRFDPTTGAASVSYSPYVVQSVSETRFRIAGNVQIQRPDAMLIDAAMPWRADWLTYGLYDDGWTRPRTTARIRVFAQPGQRGAVLRTLTVHLRGPAGIAAPYVLRTNTGVARGVVPADGDVHAVVTLCVPAGGHAEARLSTPVDTSIPGDLDALDASLAYRRGGLFVADMSLANEVGPRC